MDEASRPGPERRTGASSPDAPRVDWVRAGEGLQLAGIALFLLMNTTGVLPWSFWLDAFTLWPVLVMAAGLRIAFERTRLRPLVLLGPALVLGTLAWLAFGSRPAVAADWKPVTAERPEGVDRLRLIAHLAGARLDLAARALPAGTLAEGRKTSSRRRARLGSERDGATAVLEVVGGQPAARVFLLPGGRDWWDLALPRDLPADVQIDGAALRGTLDLRGGRLERARMNGVFLDVDLRLPRPEQDVEIHLGGVFNAFSVRVPEGTPVRVSGPAINFIDRGPRATAAAKGPGYDIRIDGVFSAVTVEPFSPASTPEKEPGAPASTG
jgi:hypothetical protein